MRVLTFSWEYPPVVEGGLGRHVQGLAQPLVASGVDVHVISRGLPPVSEPAGVIVHRVAPPPFPREIDAFLSWVADLNVAMSERATEVVAGESFDLVHSHDWLVADTAQATARALRVPWLVTVHATEHGRHRGWVQRHPQSAIHGAERAMARAADHLITCSDAMARHVAAVYGIPGTRITTLRNGIDCEALHPAPADPAGARAAYAAADEPLVLLAGRLVYEKGFHLALEALSQLLAVRPGIRFVVAGTGTAEEDLRAQAHALGLDRAGAFLGWVDDATLHTLYRVADVCLIPSLYEPFGIVALEAMACGCPVIVADTGGLREIVPGDESVGLRVRADDAGALRAGLERLLDDPGLRARMATAAPALARLYDWPAVAEATRALYERLLTDLHPVRSPGGPSSAPVASPSTAVS